MKKLLQLIKHKSCDSGSRLVLRYMLFMLITLTSFLDVSAQYTGTYNSPSDWQIALMHSINDYRAGLGLVALPMSADMTRIAELHAKDAIENNPCGLTSCTHSWSSNGEWASWFNGSGDCLSYVADPSKGYPNTVGQICTGPWNHSDWTIEQFADTAVNNWHNSPSHRAILRTPCTSGDCSMGLSYYQNDEYNTKRFYMLLTTDATTNIIPASAGYGSTWPNRDNGTEASGGTGTGGGGSTSCDCPNDMDWTINGADIFNANSGNVGIGNTLPSEKLEVNGNVKATAFIGDGSQLTGINNEGNFGQLKPHTTYSDFNETVGGNRWGWNFVMGNLNAPNSISTQWYRFTGAIGSVYTNYHLDLAFPRFNQQNAGVWMRAYENGNFHSWVQVGSKILGDFSVGGNATVAGNASVTGSVNADLFVGKGLYALRGNTSTDLLGLPQVRLGYNGTQNYSHAIRTRHNSGSGANNAMDFFVWNRGVDQISEVGTKHVMTLDGAEQGRIGIGTYAPAEKLHIKGSILLDAFRPGENRGLFFREGFNLQNIYNLSILTYDHNEDNHKDGLSINGYDGISFSTFSNERNERMRIARSGNVGIGTNNPQHKLDVAGTVKADDFVDSAGNSIVGGGLWEPEERNFEGNIGFGQKPTAVSKILWDIRHIVADNELGLGQLALWSNDQAHHLVVGNSGVVINSVNPGTYSLQISNGSVAVNGAVSANQFWLEGSPFASFNSTTNSVDFSMPTAIGGPLVSGSMLSVDGRVYISEEGGTEAGFNDQSNANYQDFLLWVEEGIVSNDYAIAETTDWPDYVFDEAYKMSSIEEVESYILEQGHLPNFPAAAEVETMGYTVDDMTKRLVKTVEEMTLHNIQQEKQIIAQNKLIKSLISRLEVLEQSK
ncbi:MAG: hypothetical protein JXR10_17625 [Cyclobacteriaceae bacterium]